MVTTSRWRALNLSIAVAAALAVPWSASAHVPSVSQAQPSTPETAILLEDPTLSRAIGATIAEPGEVDWYRMDLTAGDPLVVGMTAPDAVGSLPATFVLLGPGLTEAAAAGPLVTALAAEAGATGAMVFLPAVQPEREIHAGLGFLNYGMVDLVAPVDGTYWIVVTAVDPTATGKYVLAPGVREEFGPDAFAGMVDLTGFFDAPWPPATEASMPPAEASMPPE